MDRRSRYAPLLTCGLCAVIGVAAAACGDSGLPDPIDAAHDGPASDAPPADRPPMGCDERQLDGMFSRAFWSEIDDMAPLPEPPASPSNAYADDEAAAELGQMLFFESSHAGPLAVGDDGTNGGLGAVGAEGKVSCASCHVPDSWFSDTRSSPNATSLGADWTDRNAPPLVDAVFYEVFGWAGRNDSLWSATLRHVERESDVNGSRLAVAHMLYEDYRDEYDAVFDEPLPDALTDTDRFPPRGRPGDPDSTLTSAWEDMTAEDRQTVNRIFANYGKAVAAYLRKLVSGNSDFDRYVAEVNASCTSDALSVSAKRGLRIFVGKAGCAECHSGPFMSDNEFHNIAVPQDGPHVPDVDTGRHGALPELLADPFNVDGELSDDRSTGKLDGLTEPTGPCPGEEPSDECGQFRTKLLRNVGETAPYMHTGAYDTLREVVELYNMGGASSGFVGRKDTQQVELNLSSSEIDDLVAFLGTLTGDAVAEELRRDTSK